MNKWYNTVICDSKSLKFLLALSRSPFFSMRMLVLIFDSTTYPFRKVVSVWYKFRVCGSYEA